MRRMALTAAAVVCGGFVGFAATSFASPDVTPNGTGWAAVEPADSDPDGDEERQEGQEGPGGEGGTELRELPRLPAFDEELLYGETVLEDPETGELVHAVQQQGEVTARDDGTVTVTSSDGTAWEWTLTDDTVVRDGDNWDADPDTIEVGDTVLANGTREGDVRTAASIGDPIELPAEFGEGLEGLPLPEDLQEQDGQDGEDGSEESPGDLEFHQLPELEPGEDAPEQETPSQAS